MTAAQVMTKAVYTVHELSSCAAAAQLMWEHDIGSVPVVDEDRHVVGIVTDRDICIGAYTIGQRLADIPVGAVMAKTVILAKESDDLPQVEELMRANQIRRLPVIDDDGRLSGIIAMADLARRHAAVSTEETVSERDIAQTLDAVSQPHASAI